MQKRFTVSQRQRTRTHRLLLVPPTILQSLTPRHRHRSLRARFLKSPMTRASDRTHCLLHIVSVIRDREVVAPASVAHHTTNSFSPIQSLTPRHRHRSLRARFLKSPMTRASDRTHRLLPPSASIAPPRMSVLPAPHIHHRPHFGRTRAPTVPTRSCLFAANYRIRHASLHPPADPSFSRRPRPPRPWGC